MTVKKDVDLLATEVAAMRREIGEVRAGLGKLLEKLDRPPAVAVDVGDADRLANNGAHAAATGVSTSRSGGGLVLSEGQLGGMLDAARARARMAGERQMVGSTLSLEAIASASKAIGSAASSGGRGHDVTVSLSELARMLKGARSGKGDKAQVPRTPSSRIAPRRLVRRSATGQTAVAAASSGESQRPDEGKLDVNLVANLVRWVGTTKRLLGTGTLRTLVETYALTGHMTPVVGRVIADFESLSILPDESDHHSASPDDLADATLRLHGIIYGAGRPPAEPAVDFEVSDALRWVDATAGPASEAPVSIDGPDRLPKAYGEALSALRAGRRSRETPATNGRAVQKVHVAAGPASETDESPATPGKAHASDMSDAEWGRVEALVPRIKPGGRPGKYDRREIVNGILYQARTGCSWRRLALDLPPWKIVHHYSRVWREDGTWAGVAAALAEATSGPQSRVPVAHGSVRHDLAALLRVADTSPTRDEVTSGRR